MQRETMEWVNFWWENATDKVSDRILFIGDSITNSYRGLVQERLNNMGLKINIDLTVGSRGAEDPALFAEIEYMLSDINFTDYKLIHFNNGIHGDYITPENYENGMRKYIGILQNRCPNAKIVLVTSTIYTPIGKEGTVDTERNAFILERNAIVRRLSAEYGLELDDLFEEVAGHAEYPQPDTCHYGEEGRNKLADTVTKKILSLLSK